MGKRLLLWNLCLLLACRAAAQQQPVVYGAFRADSVEIGKPVAYVLSVSYPRHLNVLFPDSLYAFAPFEWHHKTFFPTRTEGDISRDSAVYFLSSFSTDSLQTLRLPVFVVNESDCTVWYARRDSLWFKSSTGDIPDSIPVQRLPLRANTAYHRVKRLLNYPFILTIAGVAAALLVGVWALFGKDIRRYFRRRKLNAERIRFLRLFEEAILRLQKNYSPTAVEATVLIWKRYMTALWQKPFTAYTSEEVFGVLPDKDLYRTLQRIDRRIYSRENHSATDDMLFAFLRKKAETCFQQKIKEIERE